MSRQVRQWSFGRRVVAGTAFAFTLAGCQSVGLGTPGYTGSIGETAVISPSDLTAEQALAAVQKWGSAYGRDAKDKIAAMNYAAALRAAGETNQAVAVMRKAAIYHPEDREVLASFGKALAAAGQFNDALVTVRRAQRADNPDWQLLSTEGGILDSLGKHDEARARYRQALVLAPGEPQVLNNLGLSLALTGDVDEAEATLRQAAASPKATLKIRENLAMVLRLRGQPQAAGSALPAAPDTAAVVPDAAPQGAEQPDPWEELAKSG